MHKSETDHLNSLARLASSGDRNAYGKIFRICYKDIYDYIARRVGNREDAEDLVMQVFTRGLVAVKDYEDRGYSLKAWLFRIAHNAVVDHFRSKSPLAESDLIAELIDPSDVEEEVILSEEIKDLGEQIKSLSPAQSEVITLRFIEDLSVAETAMVLEKKEVTVRALQFKAIKNLQRRRRIEPGRPLDNEEVAG